jgi:molybdate transport system substrate-binding protein
MLLVAACGSEGRDGPTVFAASSLAGVLREIDPTLVYSFAGSDELARQIREGAPADVYAAASPKYPQELAVEGLVRRPVTFATNRLVVIVPAANPAGIGAVQDIGAAGVRLVVAAEGVPVGDYTRAALDELGLSGALANVVSEEDDVKGVVGKVVLGEADAGVVYATDALTVAGDVDVIEIPEQAQPAIEYQVAVVAGSDRVAEAQAFVDLLLSDTGRAALERAGFGLP